MWHLAPPQKTLILGVFTVLHKLSWELPGTKKLHSLQSLKQTNIFAPENGWNAILSLLGVWADFQGHIYGC